MATSDTDISDLPTPDDDISDLPAPPQNASWGSAVKGVAQAGGALAAGTVQGIALAANDILPNWVGGAAAKEQTKEDLQGNPILNYRGGPEAQPIMNAVGTALAPVAKVGHAIHQGIADLTN